MEPDRVWIQVQLLDQDKGPAGEEVTGAGLGGTKQGQDLIHLIVIVFRKARLRILGGSTIQW